MKEKIMYLILGILIGAILTAGGFMLFSPKKGRPNGEMPRDGMENRIRGNRPEDMPQSLEARGEDNV
ncbi:MAG: YtxH domain-containing protein [Clostridia bacterium]|jgi:gas vesicle protein|nr:YtxH domain-containing protein [Clostridia bacterium]